MGGFCEATRLRFPCLRGNDGTAFAICAGDKQAISHRLIELSHKETPIQVRHLREFLTGMRELRYAEGQDFEMLYSFGDFHADRMPQLAVELVQLKPDIIIGAATFDAVSLKKATDMVPIVIAALADPIELGLIKSYAQPGGNLTGIMPYVAGLPTKQLELARESRSRSNAYWIAG